MLNINHLYSQKDYAQRMGWSLQKLGYWVRANKLKHVKVNDIVLIYDTEIEPNKITFDGHEFKFDDELETIIKDALLEFSRNEGEIIVKDLRGNKNEKLENGSIVPLFCEIIKKQFGNE